MKKLSAILILICLLGLVCTSAMADEWDFIHAAVYATSIEEVEALANTHGYTVSYVGGEGNIYSLEGISFDNLTPARTEVYTDKLPGGIILSFDYPMAEGATAEKPGEIYAALLKSLTALYGKPRHQLYPNVGSSTHIWDFYQLGVALAFFEGNQEPYFGFAIQRSDDPLHFNPESPPFPYAPSEQNTEIGGSES